MRYDIEDDGEDDSDNPDDSQGLEDSRQPGDFIDLEDEDEEEDEEEDDYEDDEDSQGRPDPAYRPEPLGKDNSAKIRHLRKQKDDSVAVREKKLRSVVGFLIVQKGECNGLPDDYAVNLICVRDGAASGAGQVLIGLYLFTILERFQTIGHLQLGLLELAGGYSNIPGLCLYSKFGFVPSMNLAIPGCFPSPGNMPMELHFPTKYRVATIDDAKIIVCSIVAGDRYHKGFKLPLCNIRANQSVLIALKEYNRLLEYRSSKRIDKNTFRSYCSRKPDLDLINSMFGTAFETRIHSFVRDLIYDMESVNPGTLQPNVNLDPNDIEFIRIISSVGPGPNIQNRYRQATADYNTFCVKMFPAEAAIQAAAAASGKRPGGGRNKNTAKRVKRNKKTIKRNKKVAKRSKRKT
jgi:hypothetical protein